MEAHQMDDQVQQILEERARILAAQKTATKDERLVEATAFQVGDETYAIQTFLIHEVQPLTSLKWSRVPGAPGFITGVVNLRGRLFSLMDIGSYFGLPPRNITATSCVMRVRGGELDDNSPLEVCLLTDALPKIVLIHPEDIYPVPESITSAIQECAYGVTTKMLIFLDLDKLLSDPRIIVHQEI